MRTTKTKAVSREETSRKISCYVVRYHVQSSSTVGLSIHGLVEELTQTHYEEPPSLRISRPSKMHG
jgi:hypothetical protein